MAVAFMIAARIDRTGIVFLYLEAGIKQMESNAGGVPIQRGGIDAGYNGRSWAND